MPDTYHLRIKKSYAAAMIEDLEKAEAVELLPVRADGIHTPQWQMDEVKRRIDYYDTHPWSIGAFGRSPE